MRVVATFVLFLYFEYGSAIMFGYIWSITALSQLQQPFLNKMNMVLAVHSSENNPIIPANRSKWKKIDHRHFPYLIFSISSADKKNVTKHSIHTVLSLMRVCSWGTCMLFPTRTPTYLFITLSLPLNPSSSSCSTLAWRRLLQSRCSGAPERQVGQWWRCNRWSAVLQRSQHLQPR